MSNLSYHQMKISDLPENWLRAMHNRYGSEKALDPVAACLAVLLDALHWEGSARQLVEAGPYQNRPLDSEDMRNTLARLGFKTILVNEKRDDLHNRLCPCLLVQSDGVPAIVLEHTDKGFVVFDGRKPTRNTTFKNLHGGDLYLVQAVEKESQAVQQTPVTWLSSMIGRFKGLFSTTLLISFFINILSLIVPLSIMAIYDQVIGKDSPEMLRFIVFGVLGAVVFEIFMRAWRAKVQARVGARIDYIVSSKVFDQVLHLPPLFTERASVGGQVTRIREFETFRDLLSGPLATLALDLPFALIFIIAIAIIAGPLVLIPVVLGLLYLVLSFIILPKLQNQIRRAGEQRSKRHAFLVELMWSMRSVKQMGAESIWGDRFRTMSADAAWANLEVNRLNSVSQDMAQLLMIVAGAATLVFGVLSAMDGGISMGALIATMMLVWRVLSPIQTLFGLGNRIHQTRQSLGQFLSILEYDRESQNDNDQLSALKFNGQVNFDRVSMRYTANANPALLGLSFTVKPGELIGIAGDSGSGKSTIAKLMVGMYEPQGGTVSLDGIDIRQVKPITLRQTLSYVPQYNHAFPGTILDNVRLADPTASIQEVKEACRKAGVLAKIEALPHGLDTAFKDGLEAHVPQGFLRQLALARGFLRDAPVLILDEPASGLDEKDESAFLKTLAELRGHQTIIMITQRPSHMRLCDKLLTMDHGQMELFGATEAVLAERDKMRASVKTAQEKT
ncbi:peptidase domain-containing ABC transporter [Magnetovibrio sp. PR-2]|uniref:peptidase domain-containing ABC transporter n=1 Tax=Magnetovibrio sp. PR-2 TaxID=3120356 RepID=UPI002FCE6066